MLAVYQTLETVGWKVLGMIPTSELVRDAKEIERMTWLIAAAAALIAILVGVYVVASVGRPLQKLRNLMGRPRTAISPSAPTSARRTRSASCRRASMT